MSDWKVPFSQRGAAPDSKDVRLSLRPGIAQNPQGQENSFAQARLDHLFRPSGPSLAFRLKSGLQSLQHSLVSFSWPGNSPAFQGRLVVENSQPSSLFAAGQRPAGNKGSYYKYFSQGVDPQQSRDIQAGEYSFIGRLGQESARFSVRIEDEWTKGDILNAVAHVLNASSLPVQGHVIDQNILAQHMPRVATSGSTLLIAVNSGSPEQRLVLEDEKGSLLRHLALSPFSAAEGAALDSKHIFFSGTAGQPTIFVSALFDPREPSTITPGTHTFHWAVGEHSGSINFFAGSEESWKTVLHKIANAAGASQGFFTAEVRTYEKPLPSAPGSGESIPALALHFELRAPKIGERLSFAGEDGGNAISTLQLHTLQSGSDTHLHVNARHIVRAAGPVQLDDGLMVTPLESFAEAIPLSVQQPIVSVEQALADVVASFNSIHSIMRDNEELLRSGIADEWWQPVAKTRQELEDVGVRTGKKGVLWIEHDALYSALGNDAMQVKTTLTKEETGLFPRLKHLVDKTLAHGISTLFAPQASITDTLYAKPSPRTELEIEHKSRLLDLMEHEKGGLGLPSSGLVNKRG